MRKVGNSLQLSASDLIAYLQCHHLTALDRAVVEGTISKPKIWDDPLLDILLERGAAHEQGYVDHLTAAGLETIRIGGVGVSNESAAETLAAMARGVPVIVQGALSDQSWNGRADILRRVEVPSAFGDWSYEVLDTKLPRETKAASILQLCLYSELLAKHRD
jgi:predicted RecB family nuclease